MLFLPVFFTKLWYNLLSYGGFIVEKVLYVLIAYLIGSIPFSYLLGKLFKGEDLRTKGSGNLGAANAYRVLGRTIGTTVLILDTLKSGLLVFLIKYTGLFSGINLFHPLVYGFASVIGHVCPVWLKKFKGGKGVASSLGVLLVYNPYIAVIIVPIFLVTVFLTRYTSVASTVAAVSAFLTVAIIHFFIGTDWYLFVITFLVVALIIFKHRANYSRLRNRTENRLKGLNKYDAWRERNGTDKQKQAK